MLLSAPNSKDIDLSKLKMVIGGAALTKALAKAAMQRGIDIFAGYGMSESGPILTIAQLEEHELTGDLDAEAELRTKTGTPVPLVDFRIVDAEMKDVAHDGIPQQSGVFGKALGGWLPSHWRHRHYDRARRRPDYRPDQGRNQNRR